MTNDLHFLTIAEAGKRIAAREISPVALARHLLGRIEALDGQLHAFITVTGALALKQAAVAEAEIAAGRYRGPLHGIPIGLKDIYDTAGIRTTSHSKVDIARVPKNDATTTARLLESGAVLLGKHATHEFAHGGPSHDLPWPLPRNPWNLAHFVGGSSSGSAAAVAAGLSLGALGSDTGGSIRIPASMSGIAGLKPTYGRVSRHGVVPNSYSFDHCGPMAWTVEDCAILLQVIAGYDPRDPASANRPVPDFRAAFARDLTGVRIGVIRHFWEEDLPAREEARHAMEEALAVLRQLGAAVETVRVRPLQEYADVKIVIAETEIFCIHQGDLIERPGEFGDDFLRRTLAGCVFQASDYVQASRERRKMMDEMRPLYDKCDVLVTGTSAPAPRLDQYQNIDFWRKPNIFTPFNVTGQPVLSLCTGYGAEGLPLSMQIAGRPFDEAGVLGVGYAYEQATPWRARRPQLVAGTPEVAVVPPAGPTPPQLDAGEHALVEKLARRAGLTLGERERRLLFESAPYALAIAQRIGRRRARSDEPASVFEFPP